MFDVNLYTLTKTKIDFNKSKNMLSKINWANSNWQRNVALERDGMPKTLHQVFAKSRFKDDSGPWYFNNLRCSQVNLGESIAGWDRDVFLNLASDPEPFERFTRPFGGVKRRGSR